MLIDTLSVFGVMTKPLNSGMKTFITDLDDIVILKIIYMFFCILIHYNELNI